MIVVNGRTLEIPKEDKLIGFVGDNKVEMRRFEITDITLFDFDFKLDFENIAGDIGIADLTKTVETDRIFLTWDILQEHIAKNGTLYIQLRAFDLSVLKWHSETGLMSIGDSINATEYLPSPLPTEFEQMEQRVTNMQTDVTAKSVQVADNTTIVATNKQIAIDKALEALNSAASALISEQNSKISENNAKGSETSALSSMQTAVQAMTDLLAMMGTDIATLTDGKLTPSQIPSLSINDVFSVTSTDAMLLLTAQRGDVALIIPADVVTDSYILSADDATVLSNWKKLGVSYVANAGHATTADSATDSTMINGHRMVVMEETQYGSAVTVDGTVYMVFPDGTLGGV